MDKIKCHDCGVYKTLEELGGYKTCEKCRKRQKKLREIPENKNRKKQYYQLNKEKAAEYGKIYRRSVIGRYKKSKKSATSRNIIFNLTYEEYNLEISKLCYYCNGFFTQVEAGCGLDRLDCSLGYIVGNIVSCCHTCNTIKNCILTPQETKAAIRAIIKIRKKNNV